MPAPMRIAYDLRYASDHFTGIGTHAWELFTRLLELPGNERYVVLWDPRAQHRRYDAPALSRHPRVEWHAHPWHPIRPVDVLRVGRWLRATRPDVYLSPFYLLPWRAPCPCALTLHDVSPLRRPGEQPWLTRLLFRVSMPRTRTADVILTSSAFSRQEIITLLHAPAARVRCVPLGVPRTAAPAEARRPHALGEGPFALVVGDNRPRKNLAVLARAWALFGAEPPLALVSAGPAFARHPSLPQLAARAGARGVTGLGWVDGAELEWLYRHATLVLFPSHYEGFGFPLVEAFSRGLPVVAADSATLVEVADGAAALVPPDAPGPWAEAVRRLARDGPAREALRVGGLRRAAALDYTRTAEQTLDVLREVAGTPRSTTAVPA
jgi:glycosyltransferase involved in cell wall biosynthesis